jgi:23S rRNA pseudouridine2605 synthase
VTIVTAMRIQRALARAGVASRRGADALVAAGRVTVNGAPARTGQSVDPQRDAIAVDGRPLAAVRPATWLVMNKPAGVLTTKKDPRGRRTVFELAPDVPALTYVGRLDYLTEGVLLLTTDGEGAHALTHPSREVEREYVATVRGPAGDAVRQARRGVELEDGWVRPDEIDAHPRGNGRWDVRVVIAEGRNREVRRLCQALGLDVERLVRTRFGPVRLGTLPAGATRPLTSGERTVIDALIARGH